MQRNKKDHSPTEPIGPLRGIRYTSAYCLRLSRLVWEWLLASIPLDLAVVLLRGPLPESSLERQNELLVALLLIAGAGLLREQLFGHIARLRAFQKKLTSRHLVVLLIVLGLLGAIEIGSRALAHGFTASPLLILGAAVVVAVSALRGAREMKRHGERFIRDRFAQVEQANTLHLLLVAAPLVASRAISLVTARFAEDPIIIGAGTLGATALLMALYPRAEDFMAPCPRCCRMTSRVVKVDGCCPLCSPQQFLDRPQ